MVKHAPEILLENDHFVVLNKPSGLLSIPDREGKEISLKAMLQEKYGDIFTVHRLDRDTSGIIVFAKDQETHKFLSQSFEDRTVAKYYLGIVQGVPAEKAKTIDAPIAENMARRGLMLIHKRGKQSITDYEVVEGLGKFALVQFRIHTGRTHQIRVHMQHVGHPIVCDELYGDATPIKVSSFKKKYNLSKSEEEERPILARLGLHAARLEFKDAQGKSYSVEAPLPKDMRALLQQLGKKKG